MKVKVTTGQLRRLSDKTQGPTTLGSSQYLDLCAVLKIPGDAFEAGTFFQSVRLGFGVELSVRRRRPQQRRVLAAESPNLWSFNSSAEFPSSVGPQKTHTHTHCIFLLHIQYFLAPPPRSASMGFPDVFPGLCPYSQQVKAARGRQASSFCTL